MLGKKRARDRERQREKKKGKKKLYQAPFCAQGGSGTDDETLLVDFSFLNQRILQKIASNVTNGLGCMLSNWSTNEAPWVSQYDITTCCTYTYKI